MEKYYNDKKMNFWETVDLELEFQNKERKDLAITARFDVSSIGKGMKSGSVPHADTAIRIAKFLNVSVEYLVSGGEKVFSYKDRTQSAEIKKLISYRDLVNKIDSMPENKKSAVIELIMKL